MQASSDDAEEALGSSAICGVCKDGGRENYMVLCDVCDRGFHLDCLEPKLTKVPEGDWMCQRCADKGHVVIHEKEW